MRFGKKSWVRFCANSVKNATSGLTNHAQNHKSSLPERLGFLSYPAHLMSREIAPFVTFTTSPHFAVGSMGSACWLRNNESRNTSKNNVAISASSVHLASPGLMDTLRFGSLLHDYAPGLPSCPALSYCAAGCLAPLSPRELLCPATDPPPTA